MRRKKRRKRRRRKWTERKERKEEEEEEAEKKKKKDCKEILKFLFRAAFVSGIGIIMMLFSVYYTMIKINKYMDAGSCVSTEVSIRTHKV